MKILPLLCVLLSVLSACATPTDSDDSNSTTPDYTLSFDRVMIVVLENQPLHASMKNKEMRDILTMGTLLTNYDALINPSQPNYIGMIAGDMLGVTGDGVYDLAEQNLVDLMEVKNVSWKAYQENYPGNCFAGDTSDRLYKRKHNPFISFDNIRNNPRRCANIVDSSVLLQDLDAGTVPQYLFYTPNMNNNGHDTGLNYAANWLTHTFLPNYLKPFNNTGNSLLVITFDEGVPGDNQIYTLLIGPKIPQGYIDNTRYTHYSLLRLIEENFGLGNLGRHDVDAERITTETWAKGTIHFADDHLVLALSIGLPLLAITIAGIVAYTIYARKKRQQRRQAIATAAEMNALLDVVGNDESV